MNAEDESHDVVKNPAFKVDVKEHLNAREHAADQVKVGCLQLKANHFQKS